MRKVLITLAAAASALAIAAPASAQYFPQPQGQAYGYNNYGQTRALQARIDRVQWQIERLDRRNVLSEREARWLRAQSRGVERTLRDRARHGLNRYEARDVEVRIARLEQRVQREAWDRNGRRGYGYNTGYSGYEGAYADRDGRNDRYEDDRGYDHD
jgi:hypothetical protein